MSYTGTFIQSLIETVDSLGRLNFADAWREAHTRQCEFEIPSDSLQLDRIRCGRSILAHEYEHVRFCVIHREYEVL